MANPIMSPMLHLSITRSLSIFTSAMNSASHKPEGQYAERES